MREREHLRRRYRAILAATGEISLLLGALMLSPLVLLLARPEEARHAPAFLLPAAVLVAVGVMLRRQRLAGDAPLSRREAAVVVVAGWVLAAAAGAAPLVALEGLDVTRAVFESISGFTTTGLSVVDVEHARALTLLWRSVMQLAGGAGLAILALAAITDAQGPGLSAAEGRGELLAPNVRASARLVVRIYVAYVALGVAALWIAGMSPFDAVNHAFCAVSTGGFSTRAAGLGHFDSRAVEAVTIVLMILGSTNFVTAWLAARGRFRAVAANGETRVFVVCLAGAVVLLLLAGGLAGTAGMPHGLRVAVFEAASALTTTGFSTVSYAAWSDAAILILVALMIVGGAACSTAGGLKQHRVHLLWRAVRLEVRRPLRPAGALEVDATWEGEERVVVPDARVRACAAFAFLYLVTLLLGTLAFAAYGNSLRDSAFEFASTIGTVGLSVGLTGPSTPDPLLWIQSAGMLLGRLEFFVLLGGAASLSRDLIRMTSPQPRAAVT